ncbi:S-receptor-like serine/threonine-protein kinase [Quillaja saponaria]|uniref:Receptor-like serine/threonine-protein kinase n=1 Tax=Quillaja saponaria TaxID=32244 RepID=A0AAD7KYJ4_QUISA|nr:S-receptor-like serine/threonine-protein kinase [Quillaja saponaria]
MENKNKLWVLFSIVILYFSINTHLSLEADTISANQSLSGDQTIVSASEVFELGFFNPGNSSNYYICMWYKKISEHDIVWVANREKPVLNKNSAELRIYGRNLVLFNESKVPIWSTNLRSNSSSSVIAVLQDSGNLVLRDGTNSSTLLWQSFDYPTNTWLPGSKVSRNKKTNQTKIITSWKNSQDPAPGLFSFELDPKGSTSYLIQWNRSKQYWTSGAWNGQIFSLIPEMRPNFLFNYSFVSNEEEEYFTFSLYNSSMLARSVIDVSGQIKVFAWLEAPRVWNLFWSQPRQQCEVYALCGAFGSCNDESQRYCNCLPGFEPKSQNDWDLNDYSSGCTRKTSLQCGNTSLANGERDKFLTVTSMALPEHGISLEVGSAEECESNCLNNCSCIAYAYDNNGCWIWHENLLNLKQLSADDSSGKSFNIKLAASEFSSPKNNEGLIVGVIVGSVSGVGLLLGFLVFVILRRRKRIVCSGKAGEGSLMTYKYKDLKNATKAFSEKLGGGGFGSVFKGTLHDSSVIAVKKLESISQGEKQFRTEVSTTGTIQHVNLVRLRGFCSEGTKKLLVYDYMPNGSLESHLFQGKNSNALNWKTRYQIALGIARGLAYLHEKCRDCIIHCDIKPENILLDAEFCPKVADFGLAKLIGRDFSRVLTTMRGTRGYLAPEWISGVAITAKADVYSYGMMLFEFVSGRRNSEPSDDGQAKFFPTLAARIIDKDGDVLSLLDPRLGGNADVEELLRICKVACWCVQDDETQRPSMGQVVQNLEGVLDVNLPPVPRSHQLFVDNLENIIFFTDSNSTGSSQARSSTSTASSQTKSNTSPASSKSGTGSNEDIP